MKPSIGRIVHFVAGANHTPDQHYPAVITHVHSETTVNLDVFRKGGVHDINNSGVKTSVVCDDSAAKINSWHWPEKVEE